MSQFFKVGAYLLVLDICLVAALDSGATWALVGFGLSVGLLVDAVYDLLTDKGISEVEG